MAAASRGAAPAFRAAEAGALDWERCWHGLWHAGHLRIGLGRQTMSILEREGGALRRVRNES